MHTAAHGAWSVLWLLIATAGLLFPSDVVGETIPRYTMAEHWDPRNGLPDDRVTSVIESKDGYIWAATPRGLARYDGHQWVIFNSKEDPQSGFDQVHDVIEDSSGHVWIITQAPDRRPCYWIDRGRPVRALPPSPGVFKPRKIIPAVEGGIWMIADATAVRAAVVDGVIRYPETRTVPNHAHLALETPDRFLHFMDDFELHTFNPDGSPRAETPLPNRRRGLKLDERPANMILAGSGEVIAQTEVMTPSEIEYRLLRWTNGVWSTLLDWTPGNSSRPQFLRKDQTGRLIVPLGGQVARLNESDTLDLIPNLRPSADDFILDVCFDSRGSVWVATESSGLYRFAASPFQFSSPAAGTNTVEAQAVLALDGDHVLAGSNTGVSLHTSPLDRVDATGPTRQPPVLWQVLKGRTGDVRTMGLGTNGTVWLGGRLHGLSHWSEGGEVRFAFMPPSTNRYDTENRKLNKIRTLRQSSDSLWVGVPVGMIRLQGTKARHYSNENFIPLEADVRCILPRPNGDVWFGTSAAGIFVFTQDRLKHEPAEVESSGVDSNGAMRFVVPATRIGEASITVENGLASNSVWTFCEATNGDVWAGTSQGLTRFRVHNGQLETRSFGLNEGLPWLNAPAVVIDNHNRLWVGSSKGIYQVDLADFQEITEGRRSRVRYDLFEKDKDLGGAGCNGEVSSPSVVKTAAGVLWFATTKGPVCIDPSKALERIKPSPPILEALLVNGVRTWDWSPQAQGAHGAEPRPTIFQPGQARQLEMEVTSPHFGHGGRVEFSYQLEGAGVSTWSAPTHRRFVHYASLRPGAYVFRARSRADGGEWGAETALLAFAIQPHPWERTWVQGAVVVVGAMGVWGIGRREVGRLRRVHALESQNEKLRTRQILEDQRRAMARNIHDDFGSGLVTLRSHLTDPRALELVERLHDSARDLIAANAPENLMLGALAAQIREHAARSADAAGLRFHFEFDEGLETAPTPSAVYTGLLSLSKEAVANVIKHARATELRLALRQDGTHLILEVRDNGRGFDPDHPTRRGQGLGNMRHRAERCGGVLTCDAHRGQGTRIEARVPLSPATSLPA